jgi:hypothetical protein
VVDETLDEVVEEEAPEVAVHDDEILESQERLGQALDRARAGEDRALATAVREDGELFVRVFYGLLRMIRLHDLDNKAFARPITDFVDVTHRLCGLLGAVNVVCVEEQVYINDIRIRFDERAESGRMMGTELLRHRIGGVSIHAPLTEEHVKALVHIFAADPDPDTPRTAISEALTKAGVDALELFGVFRFRVTGEAEVEVSSDSFHSEEEVVALVDRGAGLVEDSLDNLGSNRMPNPLPMRRVVTEIIEGGVGAEGLWDEPGASNPFSTHVVRVARLSMVIGKGIGLNDEGMQDLGVAALFHDMGYGAREGAEAAKDGKDVVEGYAPPFERHAAAGARLLLRQRGFHPAKILRILATLEHHDDFLRESGKPSLFARIIRIAEDFDNLIRSKGGGFTSSEALSRMVAYTGTRYDPDLIQTFVNAMGKYPPGTMMLLSDGSIAVSIGICRAKESFDKPVVRVVRDSTGSAPVETRIIDLSEGGEVRLVLNSRPESLHRATDDPAVAE